MLVIKVYMWPGGNRSRERFLTQASLSLQGVANKNVGDVQKGERRYRLRIFKGARFGGPRDGDDLPADTPKSKIWRECFVRGHRPGKRGAAARGEWDLIGGALSVILGHRLSSYRRDEP